MPTIKLTERSVVALPAPNPSGKQVLHWDASLKGFGVICSGISATRSYVVQSAVGGRTRRVTIGACNVLTLVAARQKAKELLAGMIQGKDPKAGRNVATLADALQRYLAGRQLSANTRSSYANLIGNHLSSWLKLPIDAITVEMVEERHTELAEKVGAATANGAMRTLRLLWNSVLEKRPDLGANPVRLRSRWHKVRPRTRLVKAEQLPAFYAAVNNLPNPVHRDYILTLMFAGMRRRECAALRWEHIDFAARTMTIPEKNTKAGRELALPLSDFLLDLLVRRRQIGDSGWVFPSNSKSGHLEEPKFALNLVEKTTGIKVSPHDLRRGYITAAESCDISLLALMALVNHSPGKSVTAGYVQMTPKRLREPAQRVADRLKELCGIEAAGGNVARLR